jgi:hypothetical protein
MTAAFQDNQQSMQDHSVPLRRGRGNLKITARINSSGGLSVCKFLLGVRDRNVPNRMSRWHMRGTIAESQTTMGPTCHSAVSKYGPKEAGVSGITQLRSLLSAFNWRIGANKLFVSTYFTPRVAVNQLIGRFAHVGVLMVRKIAPRGLLLSLIAEN